MRTVGRKIRPGERRRWKCDRCNTLWDKRDLKRDGEGMWVCPQEGSGRDGATLARGNAEHLRAYAERLRVPGEITGRYGNTAVEALPLVVNLLQEDGFPILTEDDEPLIGP